MNDVRLFPLDDTRRRHPDVEAWFAVPNPLRAIARRWFEVMRGCGDDVTEVLHDGHPTACVGNVAFGYVNAFSEHVNVGFFVGSILHDPAGLLEGTGRFMRHARIRPDARVDEVALRALIGAAHRVIADRVTR